MNKLLLLGVSITIVLFISSCNQNIIKCNSPYENINGECCLDKNGNGICDSGTQISEIQQLDGQNIKQDYAFSCYNNCDRGANILKQKYDPITKEDLYKYLFEVTIQNKNKNSCKLLCVVNNGIVLGDDKIVIEDILTPKNITIKTNNIDKVQIICTEMLNPRHDECDPKFEEIFTVK